LPPRAREELEELTEEEEVGKGGPPFPLVVLFNDPNIRKELLLDDLLPGAGEEERGVMLFVCCVDGFEPSPPPVGVRSLLRTFPNKFEDFPIELGVDGGSL
jgi:hypothetical protein